jgi:hypothetical protein
MHVMLRRSSLPASQQGGEPQARTDLFADLVDATYDQYRLLLLPLQH